MTSRQSSEPPEPDPDRTPGLEPRGSAPPGETPPDAASATGAVSHKSTPSAQGTKWLWIAGIAVIVLLVAAFFGFLAAGMLL